MPGQNFVSYPQSAELTKQGEHSEVQLSWQWVTTSQKEVAWCRCRSGLVESEQPLYKVLFKDVFFFGGQDKASQSREDDGSSKDCLHSEASCRVCLVSFF